LDRLSNYGKYVGGAVGGAVGYKATDSKDFSTGDRILAAGIGGALGAGAGNEIAKRLATKLKHRNLIKTIGRAPGILERLKEIRPLKRPGVQDEYHDLMAKVMKRD
jgi:UDP-N-acetylglucosamine:LPS N-acetylglucosamine transferase